MDGRLFLGHAMCAENQMVLHLGMSAPHGGFDPKAENQQLLFSGIPRISHYFPFRPDLCLLDGDDDSEVAIKRRRKRTRMRDKAFVDWTVWLLM